MARRLLKHALTCNERHRHNRKGAENESCSQQGTQCVYATLSACVCYVSLAEIKTNAHMLRLANWQINVAIMLAQQKLLNIWRTKNDANSKGKYWEIHAFMNIMSSDIKALAPFVSFGFIICCLSLFALSLSLLSHCPFYFALSKYVKAKRIDAKRLQNS